LDKKVSEQHAAYIFKIDPEDGGSMFFSNVDVNVQDYTVAQYRGVQSEPMWCLLTDPDVVLICHAYVSVALTD
jgi:hypothetical protein